MPTQHTDFPALDSAWVLNHPRRQGSKVVQVISTLDELDEKIGECDRATSSDELYAVFRDFRMSPPAELPADPFSAEYTRFQMALYRQLAGKDYRTTNEAVVFELETALTHPFPYLTGSCTTTGEHLMTISFLLRVMALSPRSRVLELGAGWGNTTLILAKLGHAVTAVDIEPRFCELIKQRAAREDLASEVVNSDFMWVRETREPFDAVLFFGSFHHSDDHLRLLWCLQKVVSTEGRIFFAAEPIQPDFPYPWGLRLDGQSLWAIRKYDSGFSDAYFAKAFSLTGWFGRKRVAADPAGLNVWEVRRDRTVFRFTAGWSRSP